MKIILPLFASLLIFSSVVSAFQGPLVAEQPANEEDVEEPDPAKEVDVKGPETAKEVDVEEPETAKEVVVKGPQYLKNVCHVVCRDAFKTNANKIGTKEKSNGDSAKGDNVAAAKRSDYYDYNYWTAWDICGFCKNFHGVEFNVCQENINDAFNKCKKLVGAP